MKIRSAIDNIACGEILKIISKLLSFADRWTDKKIIRHEIMPKKKPNKPLQRLLILGSSLLFFSSTAFALFGMFTSSSQTQETTQIANSSIEDELKKQSAGYQSVLQREPNNTVALQGFLVSQKRLEILYVQELQKEPNNAEVLKKITTSNEASKKSYQQLEISYQDILKKEQNNPVALENLATIRWYLRNSEGAIETLEKLIELYPDRDRYKENLKIIKQQIAKEKEAEAQKNNVSQ